MKTRSDFFQDTTYKDTARLTSAPLKDILKRPPLRNAKGLILIPDRNMVHVDCAASHPLDPARGPLPLIKGNPRLIASPEYFPFNIKPMTHLTQGNQPPFKQHSTSLFERLQRITPEKIATWVRGSQPVAWCEKRHGYAICGKCMLEEGCYYIGRGIILPGGWGEGTITEVIRMEQDYVAFLVEGPYVHTTSHVARIRVPLDYTYLNRWLRAQHFLLKLVGKVPVTTGPLGTVLVRSEETLPP